MAELWRSLNSRSGVDAEGVNAFVVRLDDVLVQRLDAEQVSKFRPAVAVRQGARHNIRLRP